MGRNVNQEAVAKLRAALAATDDPQLIAQLTRQLTKLVPRPKQKMGRPRNETPTRKTLAKDAAALEAQSTFKESDYPYRNQGAHLATLPMGKRECWRLVFGIENERLRRVMTKAEEVAFEESMVASFSDAERAALSAYDPCEGQGRPEWPGLRT